MDMFTLFAQYGLIALFLGVLTEQIGVPIPAMPLLVLAGVTAMGDAGFALEALFVAVLASMLADFLWFYAGRRFGRKVLGLLCRVSISPDTCVRQSELSFARRGEVTLVIGKFIPGVSLLTSPMAGAIGMPFGTFVLYNLAGTTLWAGSGIFLGVLFNNQARLLLAYLADMGSAALPVVLCCIGIYIAYRAWRRWRVQVALANVPRVAPHELRDLMMRGAELVVLDVRPKLATSSADRQLPGASRIELTEIETVDLSRWAPGAQIVVYCACPNDASALKAAHHLIKRGRPGSVLKGGFDGWVNAGFHLDLQTTE